MKKLFNRRIPAFLLAASLLLLTSCDSSDANTVNILAEYKSDEEFNSSLESQQEVLVASNDNLRMYVSPDNAVVTVKNSDGICWSTNPENAETVEKSTNLGNSLSQMRLSYFNDNYKTVTLDSYSECIEKQQFSFYKIENGLGVNYFFGNQKQEYLAPKIISVETYNWVSKALDDTNVIMFQAFYQLASLENLDDTTKAVMKEKYPILEKQDVYVLQVAGLAYEDISDDIFQRIHNIFEAAGYTKEDLAKDQELDLSQTASIKQLQISIAIEYRLTDNGITATIPKDSISYDASYITLTEIELLPYFEAADSNQQGYMLLPDLSGSLVNLNNGKFEKIYKKRVYGEENTLLTVDEEETEINKSEIYFPIFGQKTEQNSYLAVIEEGAGYAYINCHTANDFTVYNQVYSSFVIQNMEPNKLSYNGSQTVYATQKEPISSDISVKYIFNDDTNANYNTLALEYKNYLLDEGLIQKNNSSDKLLNINIISSVKGKKSVLGIPVIYDKSMTSFEQTEEIINLLNSKGMEKLDFNILSWSNGGLSNSMMDKIEVIGEIGGKKGYLELLSLKNDDLNIYSGVNFAYFSKSVFDKKYAAENLRGLMAEFTSYENEDEADAYILNLRFLTQIVEKFIKKYDKLADNSDIYDLNSATVLNADYSDNTFDREKSIESLIESAEKIYNAGHSIKYKGANSYMLKYAAALDNVETKNTNNLLFDATVPFVQIVLSGVIPYYSTPINTADDYDAAWLACVETGTLPTFNWFYEENFELINTKENYYSSNYEAWLDEASAVYKEAEKIKSETQNSCIISHSSLSENIYETVYENGCRIIVNYSNKDYSIYGTTVPALDYTIVR